MARAAGVLTGDICSQWNERGGHGGVGSNGQKGGNGGKGSNGLVCATLFASPGRLTVFRCRNMVSRTERQFRAEVTRTPLSGLVTAGRVARPGMPTSRTRVVSAILPSSQMLPNRSPSLGQLRRLSVSFANAGLVSLKGMIIPVAQRLQPLPLQATTRPGFTTSR